MAQVTADLAKRLAALPHDLKTEFLQVPLDAIEHEVDRGARELLEGARFNDYVPLLVHRNVRERLRASQPSANAGPM